MSEETQPVVYATPENYLEYLYDIWRQRTKLYEALFDEYHKWLGIADIDKFNLKKSFLDDPSSAMQFPKWSFLLAMKGAVEAINVEISDFRERMRNRTPERGWEWDTCNGCFRRAGNDNKS
jgi:hypothetical protein